MYIYICIHMYAYKCIYIYIYMLEFSEKMDKSNI